MACSAVLLAKRSLVALLLRLATAYQVVVSINRDSPDVKVTQAFRKVVLKVHPDKGGSVGDAQEAADRWLTNFAAAGVSPLQIPQGHRSF